MIPESQTDGKTFLIFCDAIALIDVKNSRIGQSGTGCSSSCIKHRSRRGLSIYDDGNVPAYLRELGNLLVIRQCAPNHRRQCQFGNQGLLRQVERLCLAGMQSSHDADNLVSQQDFCGLPIVQTRSDGCAECQRLVGGLQ